MRLSFSLARIKLRRLFSTIVEKSNPSSSNSLSTNPTRSEWWYISRGAAASSIILLPLLALNVLYEDVSIRQEFEDWDDAQTRSILFFLRTKLGMKIPKGNSIYNESATPLTDDAAEGPEDAYFGDYDIENLELNDNPTSRVSTLSTFLSTTSFLSNPWKVSFPSPRGEIETKMSIKRRSDQLSLHVRSLRDTVNKLQINKCTRLVQELAQQELNKAELELNRFQHLQDSPSTISLSSIFVPSILGTKLREDYISMTLLPTPNDKIIPPLPPSPTIQTSIDNARDWIVSFMPTTFTKPEEDGETSKVIVESEKS
jgi:hypothetical protein